MMMYEEEHGRYNEYSLFHCFLNNAYHEYMLAKGSDDEQPDKAETDHMAIMYGKSRQYAEMFSCRKGMQREASAIIGGIPLPENFNFRDCTIAGFQHDTDSALLKLSHSDTTVTLKFHNLFELSSTLIPKATWVSGVSCYRCGDGEAVMFDIGYYRILCGKIEAAEISDGSHTPKKAKNSYALKA